MVDEGIYLSVSLIEAPKPKFQAFSNPPCKKKKKKLGSLAIVPNKIKNVVTEIPAPWYAN